MEVTVLLAVPPLVPVTVRVAEEVAVPLNAAALAAIVVVPALMAVARPVVVFTVATAGAEEVHVTPAVKTENVFLLALPNVPTA